MAAGGRDGAAARSLAAAAGGDLYSRLGCSRDASTEQLRRAFRLRALRIHPDKVEGSRGHDELGFDVLYGAFCTLRDPKARAAYDAQLGCTLAQPFTPETAKPEQKEGPDAFQAEGLSFSLEALRYLPPGRRKAWLLRLPRRALEALAELAAQRLRGEAPPGSEAWSAPRSANRPQSLDAGGLAPRRRGDTGGCKGIYRRKGGLGPLEAQIASGGFLVRWHGRDWALCVRAYESLAAIKAGLAGNVREGNLLAMRDVARIFAETAAEDNSGWPFPFQVAAVRHVAGKRYHSPWVADLQLAVRYHRLLSVLVAEGAHPAAVQRYKQAVADLEATPVPLTRVLRHVLRVSAAVGTPSEASGPAAACPSTAGREGGAPRRRLRGKQPPPFGWLAVRVEGGPPVLVRRRLRGKQRPPPARGELVDADADHCAREPQPPCEGAPLHPCARVPLPWLRDLMDRRGMDEAECERLMQRVVEAPAVQRYLRDALLRLHAAAKGVATKRRLALEDAAMQESSAKQLKACPPGSVVGTVRPVQASAEPRGVATGRDCLSELPSGLQLQVLLWLSPVDLWLQAVASQATRASLQHVSPQLFKKVAFEQGHFLRGRLRSSSAPQLRTVSRRKGAGARTFLGFLGLPLVARHCRYLDLADATQEVVQCENLLPLLLRFEKLRHLVLGLRGWASSGAMKRVMQQMAVRGVHIDVVAAAV